VIVTGTRETGAVCRVRCGGNEPLVESGSLGHHGAFVCEGVGAGCPVTAQEADTTSRADVYEVCCSERPPSVPRAVSMIRVAHLRTVLATTSTVSVSGAQVAT